MSFVYSIERGTTGNGRTIWKWEVRRPGEPAVNRIYWGRDRWYPRLPAPGVPADGGLRRPWSSDSAVRDFVGLSKYSRDFNAPGAMPGFGPIDKEIERPVRLVLGEPDATLSRRDGQLLFPVSQLRSTLVPGQNEPTQESNIAEATNDATPILARRKFAVAHCRNSLFIPTSASLGLLRHGK